MPNWKHLLWGCGICCGLLSLLAACRPIAPQPASVTVNLTKADDRATVTTGAENEKDASVIIDLHSESGIGGATITWSAGDAPTSLQLHLYLRGLEELNLTGGPSTVRASISSSPPFPLHESLVTTGGAEQTLAAGDAYWTPIEPVPAALEVFAIPLKEGYFNITVPTTLIQDADGVLKVRWVDFYR